MAKGTKSEPTKSLFHLTDENRKKLKVVSALSDQSMKEIVNEALEMWFAQYEKKNGKIPVK